MNILLRRLSISARQQARDLAIAWFDRYLKNNQPSKSADATASQPVSH